MIRKATKVVQFAQLEGRERKLSKLCSLHNHMAAKYKYYIIQGFVPVYQQRTGLRITPGMCRGQGAAAARSYYAGLRATLPKTRKLVEFDSNTTLYLLKYNADDLALLLRATRPRDAVIAFEALRYLVAWVRNCYELETDLIPLRRKPHFNESQTQDLFDLVNVVGPIDRFYFESALHSGLQVTHLELLELVPQLKAVFGKREIRRALACLCQSQAIYLTRIVESYVAVHSRPELMNMSREEFAQQNFQYQEMLHASLLTCYRGIEAIYSKNFKLNDFKKVNRGKLQALMDIKVPNMPSRSRYPLRFYCQRHTNPPKHKLVITMLEILLRARNRAAHGHRWTPLHRLEIFGSDLVDEAKFYLTHLISSTLPQ